MLALKEGPTSLKELGTTELAFAWVLRESH